MAEGIRKKEPKRSGAAKATPKPKKAKPSEEAPLAAAPEPTTALARVEGADITEPHSKAVIREAQRLDDKIVKTIERVQKDFVVLGEMFQEMQDKGLHRALINPETGKAFGQFGDYLKARYPDQSRTQISQAMRIVRELTSGPNPTVSKDDVREMSRDNAEGLAKLKKAGREITPEIIEQAKAMPVRIFEDEVVKAKTLAMDPVTRGSDPTDLQPEVLVKRVFYLAGTTSSNLDKAVEIIKFLGEGVERDKGQGLDDYVVGALVGEFLAAYAADYEEMKRVRNASAVHAITVHEDAQGPEAGGVDADDTKTETAEAFDAAVVATCQHVKEGGVACKSPAVKGSEYCFYHKKLYPQQAAAEQRDEVHAE